MNTRILVIRNGTVIDRRYLPEDVPAGDGYQAQRVATYRDPHYVTSHPVNMNAAGRLKIGAERQTWVPAEIQVGTTVYAVASLATGKAAPVKERGKVISKAMVISPEDAARLDEMDAAIIAAQMRRLAFMLEAAERGRMITRADCLDKTPAKK